MKADSRKASVLAGTLLIMYGLPWINSFLLLFSSGDLFCEKGHWSEAILALLVLSAGLLLICRKPKLAAALMSAFVLVSFFTSLSEIAKGFQSIEGGMLYAEEGGHPIQIPAYLVLTQPLLLLAELLLAVMLYTRGKTAWLLSWIAAASMLASTVFQFLLFGYFTGHPTPLNLYFPLAFIIAAISAGCSLQASDT